MKGNLFIHHITSYQKQCHWHMFLQCVGVKPSHHLFSTEKGRRQNLRAQMWMRWMASFYIKNIASRSIRCTLQWTCLTYYVAPYKSTSSMKFESDDRVANSGAKTYRTTWKEEVKKDNLHLMMLSIWTKSIAYAFYTLHVLTMSQRA